MSGVVRMPHTDFQRGASGKRTAFMVPTPSPREAAMARLATIGGSDGRARVS